MNRVFHYSESKNIYYNLALEEYFVRNFDFDQQELLLIYINEPSIVLGKNQNFFQEVHLSSYFYSEYKLARRISGGGTVVHDRGNINFAFFEKHQLKNVNNYDRSTGRLVDVLNELGIGAKMNDRNAILLGNGKKISGSAQFSSSSGILSHLTLLFDSDLDKIDTLIQKNPYALQTKASKSIRSTIDNIINYTSLNQEQFIQECISKLGFDTNLTKEFIDGQAVNKLILEKYGHQEYYFDTAATGIISFQGIEIEMVKGKITNINGMKDSSKYIGKRLYPSEIPLDNSIWQNLFH
jgi:lipoate-protein ligase A